MATVEIGAEEARTQRVFAALLRGLAYPGRVQTLPEGSIEAYGAIAEALVDLETTFYTPSGILRTRLARLGGRERSAGEALYQFYPRDDALNVEALRQAPAGDALQPDASATIVVGARLDGAPTHRLTGPGIPGHRDVAIRGLPEGFWRAREEANRYPLGWDVYLVDNDRLLGLPRTTRVEAL